VIDVVGDGTELLLNNRPEESGALRFEIVSLDLCRMPWRYRTVGTVGKNSGRLELTDSR
jgi:hypothetical protein